MTKWYHRVLRCICAVLLSPLLLLGFCTAAVVDWLEMPKNKKAYTSSAYYKAFRLPYKRHLLYSPEYRFYNAIAGKGQPIGYTRQASNGLEYFVLENVLYLFPDFDQILFHEEKHIWEADNDGDLMPFEEAYRSLVSKLDKGIDAACIKLLVERGMFPLTDLTGIRIPDCICLAPTYESAFQKDAPPPMLRMPETANEVLAMMKQTPGLCGHYDIVGTGTIVWELYESFQIEISADCLTVYQQGSGKRKRQVTHWHPSPFQICDQVYQMGRRGNVLVIRRFFAGAKVLYMGRRENCPYKERKCPLLGKTYVLEAK